MTREEQWAEFLAAAQKKIARAKSRMGGSCSCADDAVADACEVLDEVLEVLEDLQQLDEHGQAPPVRYAGFDPVEAYREASAA